MTLDLDALAASCEPDDRPNGYGERRCTRHAGWLLRGTRCTAWGRLIVDAGDVLISAAREAETLRTLLRVVWSNVSLTDDETYWAVYAALAPKRTPGDTATATTLRAILRAVEALPESEACVSAWSLVERRAVIALLAAAITQKEQA